MRIPIKKNSHTQRQRLITRTIHASHFDRSKRKLKSDRIRANTGNAARKATEAVTQYVVIGTLTVASCNTGKRTKGIRKTTKPVIAIHRFRIQCIGGQYQPLAATKNTRKSPRLAPELVSPGTHRTPAKPYHTWRLIPEPSGCRVVTEEVGIGPNDIKAPASASKLMHQAHDLWLASLRWRSEQ